ncbi:MAG TPA: type VI secretion system tube protein Hcp [Edaphobacter sp.]|jgi:type VI protein secretion system component Hcp|nr:type VI secretion system tube protein Hcp [Edaphobacter sp.]
MKLLLSAVCPFFLATSALAQQGAVVVNVGAAVNCVTTKGETGFDATSYVLGGTEGTGKPGATQAAGKPALTDLSISKNFDACSEQLIQSFLSGKVIPSMTLIQYSNSASNQPYAALTITLTNAMINSYEVTGAPSVHPAESLSFSYRKVCMTSVSQRPDGSLGSPVHVCYDVVLNQLS